MFSLHIFVGPATTQNLVVKFDGEICRGGLVEHASDDFPQQKKLENHLPNFAGTSPPISPTTSPTSLWKSLVLIFARVFIALFSHTFERLSVLHPTIKTSGIEPKILQFQDADVSSALLLNTIAPQEKQFLV